MAKLLINFFIILLLIGCTAERLYDDYHILNQSKDAAQANVRLAVALLNQGFIKDAKAKLLLAQRLDSKEPSVWYSLGYFYQQIGEMVEAKRSFERALKLAPKLAAAHNNYGAFLYQQGAYQAAMRHFLFAANDNQYLDTASAYKNAALCALKMSKKEMAKELFQKSIAQGGC